jgi:hypothetical protein
MQYAATAANELIAQQYMKMLDPFFEPADDGSLIPRTVQLALDENHYFDLPLVALSTPRGLMLEKMKVNLTIRTEGMQALSRNREKTSLAAFTSAFHLPAIAKVGVTAATLTWRCNLPPSHHQKASCV